MQKSVNEQLESIHDELVYQDFKRSHSNDSDESVFTTYIETDLEKKEKLKYYYSDYSLKKFIQDIFIVLILSVFSIAFFIYRHKRHVELVEKVKRGELKESDFEYHLH